MVNREPDRIGHRIREIINQLESRTAQRKSARLDRRAAMVVPVGQVKRRLESFRDSKFQLVPEVDLIEPAIVGLVRLPGDPVFDFYVAGRRGGDFVDISEPTRTRECRERLKK